MFVCIANKHLQIGIKYIFDASISTKWLWKCSCHHGSLVFSSSTVPKGHYFYPSSYEIKTDVSNVRFSFHFILFQLILTSLLRWIVMMFKTPGANWFHLISSGRWKKLLAVSIFCEMCPVRCAYIFNVPFKIELIWLFLSKYETINIL